MTRHISLIVNPVAGRARANETVIRATAALSTVAAVKVLESQYSGHEAELASTEARNNARAIVIVGGDGSLSHAVRGVIESKCDTPIAVIATGTGNDFVKSIGVPVGDIGRTVQLIDSGNAHHIDVGIADGKVFINSAGFGFDAQVLKKLHSKKALLSGAARYAAAAIPMLLSYSGVKATVINKSEDSIVSRSKQRYLTIVFANGSWFGGVFHIAPEARANDGLLDCIAISDASAYARMSLFARAVKGKHVRSALVATSRSASFDIEFDEPPVFQCDGELALASSHVVNVSLLPSAVRIFAEQRP